MGIVGIGLSNAKIICKEYNYDIDALLNADVDSLQAIDGIGDVLAKEWVSYMSDEKHRAEIEALCNEITLLRPDQEGVVENLSGINIVITGSLTNYSSRTELKNIIEGHGGKVTGSVTGKTNYLINNDNTSSSSKNKKAKELGVTIITEDEFIKLFLL